VVLALAAGTDILDGYIARRYGLATPTGAVVDGVTDKLFVGVVLTTLLLTNTMSVAELVLLGTRELGELPLLVWVAASAKARRRKVEDQANVFGKAATVLQFSAIVAMLVHSPIRTVLVALTVLVGAGAAVSYWHRVIVARRENA
jgi:CDP-diacylglycerol--glycerol-3-phosphate 3-phosphatidyltransferase/cardiolipin synthase